MEIPLSNKNPRTNNFSIPRVPQHTLFEVGLLILVAILFFIFILQPKRGDLAAAQDQLETAKKDAQTAQQNKDTLEGLVEQLKSHSQDVQNLDEALPLDGRAVRLQLLLESLINDAGMKVGDISVDSSNTDRVIAGDKAALANPFGKSRKLQTFNATAIVSGTFPQFETLIKKIASNGRVIDIKGFNITSSKEDLLSFQITIRAYYYE